MICVICNEKPALYRASTCSLKCACEAVKRDDILLQWHSPEKIAEMADYNAIQKRFEIEVKKSVGFLNKVRAKSAKTSN